MKWCKCCNVCNKYRKPKKKENVYSFLRKIKFLYCLLKCDDEYEQISKEEDSIEILKALGLITDMEEYQKGCDHVWRIRELGLKNINQISNYLIEEINWNELMSKKHNKVYRSFNYIERWLILISTVSGCISISAFASLVGIPIGVTSSAIGL